MAKTDDTAFDKYGARWILDRDVDLLPDVPGESPPEDRWLQAAARIRRREATYRQLARELDASIKQVARRMHALGAAPGGRPRAVPPEPLGTDPGATPQERALYKRRMQSDGVPVSVVWRLMASVR